MSSRRSWAIWLVAIASVGLVSLACKPATDKPASQQPAPKQVFIVNLTSGMNDPGRSTMALAQAGFALDEGRKVLIFLSIHGPELAQRDDPAEPFVAGKRVDASQHQHGGFEPKALLKTLIGRGAEVLACPVCTDYLKIPRPSLMEGVVVTTEKELFAKMPSGAIVFSY